MLLMFSNGDARTGAGGDGKANVALHFGPPWQTCLTPFDQLYVLLFLPMKLSSEIILLGDGTVFGTSDGELEPCEDVLSDVYVLKHIYSSLTLVPEAFFYTIFFIWKFATRSADRSTEPERKESLWSRSLRISLSCWLST